MCAQKPDVSRFILVHGTKNRKDNEKTLCVLWNIISPLCVLSELALFEVISARNLHIALYAK